MTKQLAEAGLGDLNKYRNISHLGYAFYFFSSRRRDTRYIGDWSSDVCSSDLGQVIVSVHADLGALLRALQAQLALVLALVQVAEVRRQEGAFCRLPGTVGRSDCGPVRCHGELRIRSQVGRDLLGLHLVDVEQLVLFEDRIRRLELCLHLIPGQGARPNCLRRLKSLTRHTRPAQWSRRRRNDCGRRWSRRQRRRCLSPCERGFQTIGRQQAAGQADDTRCTKCQVLMLRIHELPPLPGARRHPWRSMHRTWAAGKWRGSDRRSGLLQSQLRKAAASPIRYRATTPPATNQASPQIGRASCR